MLAYFIPEGNFGRPAQSKDMRAKPEAIATLGKQFLGLDLDMQISHQKKSYFSPAKINCFFRVLGRRPDGFCEIASLMQALSFGDFLHIERADLDSLECNDPSLPLDERNLILQATKLFRKKTGEDLYLRIKLEKNIPQFAGLGGGSSNAATTLWAMREISGRKISSQELSAWSAELGSDLPFFFSTGTAYCTGRGEQVKSLDALSLKDLDSCYLFKPSYGLSTARVFSQLDFSKTSKQCPLELLQSWQKNKPILINDLELPAFSLTPELELFKKEHQAIMTGSGTAFFSLFVAKQPKNYLAKSKFIQRPHNSWWQST